MAAWGSAKDSGALSPHRQLFSIADIEFSFGDTLAEDHLSARLQGWLSQHSSFFPWKRASNHQGHTQGLVSVLPLTTQPTNFYQQVGHWLHGVRTHYIPRTGSFLPESLVFMTAPILTTRTEHAGCLGPLVDCLSPRKEERQEKTQICDVGNSSMPVLQMRKLKQKCR